MIRRRLGWLRAQGRLPAPDLGSQLDGFSSACTWDSAAATCLPCLASKSRADIALWALSALIHANLRRRARAYLIVSLKN